jgi:hypothetical protein
LIEAAPCNRSVLTSQVSFNAGGDALLVTERLTSLLDVYTVDKDGIAQGPVVYPSSGITPFGFAFGKRDQVFVSEALESAASSYSLTPIRQSHAPAGPRMAFAVGSWSTNEPRYFRTPWVARASDAQGRVQAQLDACHAQFEVTRMSDRG